MHYSRLVFLGLLGMAAAGDGPGKTADKNPSKVARDTFNRLEKSYSANKKTSRIKSYDVAIKGTKVKMMRGHIKADTTNDKGEPVEIGIKFWAETAGEAPDYKPTGTFVNLAKHEWKPAERFFLWFEAAVPVTLGIHQKSTSGEDKQVAPDEAFPTSYQTIQPGEKWRFPLRFRLDDDTANETISLTFVRADQPDLQDGAKQDGANNDSTNKDNADKGGNSDSASNGDTPNGDTGTVGAGATIKRMKSTLNKIHTESKIKGIYQGKRTKCQIDGPIEEASKNGDDVAFVAIGEGKVAEITLEIHKQKADLP